MIAAEASQHGIACVYLESVDEINADGFDLRLTDRRVVLERPATSEREDGPVRPAVAGDISELNPLLDRLAPWSRFARDPAFGVDDARRMYGAWLERAWARPNEHVGVTALGGVVTGFVTVALATPAEIGLISVTHDGTGLGSALVTWASNRAAPAPVRVATQADNRRALKLYERSGFRRVSESHVYHLWLDDNERRG